MLPINPFDVFGRKGLEFIPVTFTAGSHVVSDEASSSGYQSPTRTGKDLTHTDIVQRSCPFFRACSPRPCSNVENEVDVCEHSRPITLCIKSIE